MKLFIGGCFSLEILFAFLQLVIDLFQLWPQVIAAGLKEGEL